ncbi:hypothetical protein NO1_0118 [Candidatus Termititenax aidoneus]|uniref:Uncharacterized protein n=1 Tax=Termititenax aidoneus TaxID=2218524 RepID=A0A388T7H8_TERA1|nr:hypothetical protein NO1_0118 [Candidatus Termititenax aidoneus]
MVKKTFETLDDGTPLTEKLVEKMVSDVYSALEKGAYRPIKNPHGKIKPIRITNQKLRSRLEKIASE